MQKQRLVVLSVAVLVIAGLCWFGWKHFFGSAKAVDVAEQPLPVARVASRDLRQILEAPGAFEPYQETVVNAKIRGYVSKLNVDIGDVVKAGQVLATLEVPELSADINKAQADIARARQDVAKERALYDDSRAVYDRLANVMKARPELIAQQDIDAAKAKSDSAYAGVTAAMSNVDAAIASAARLKDMKNYTSITAPFDGTITQRLVNVGALVGDSGMGSAIFHVSELDRLRLVVKVPENAVSDVAVGQQAKAKITALDKEVPLTVSRLSGELAQDTRTMHIELDYINADHRVAPGMYASVELPIHEAGNSMAVPVTAVKDRTDKGGNVYVLAPDGSVSKRPVVLGLLAPDYIQIKDGLKEGELVALGVTPQIDGSIRYKPQMIESKAKPEM